MGIALMEIAAVDVGLLVLRTATGLVFAMHGFQKLFGWFNGGGLAATASWFRSLGFGSGRPSAIMAGTTEAACGIGLAIGLFTPFAAAGIVATMTTAAFVNAAENGFWSVRKGWEVNWYLIVVAIAVAITGPGQLSADASFGWVLSPVIGLIAIAAGLLAGTLRWVTRTPE